MEDGFLLVVTMNSVDQIIFAAVHALIELSIEKKDFVVTELFQRSAGVLKTFGVHCSLSSMTL